MQIAVSLSSWWMFQNINVGVFFQLNKDVPFPHFWMNNNSLYHSGFTLLMYEEKSEDCQLKNNNQHPIPLPSSFPWLWQQNRSQTLKSSSEPQQAWSQSILGRLERASTYAAAEPGDNIWQKGPLGSTQQRKACPWMVPCAAKQKDGLPHQSACCPLRGRARTPPPVPWVAPVPSAPLFPAPILPHCLLVQAQLCTPRRCLGWPSARSTADYSSQNCSPGPGWAGNQDFLTLV